MLGRNQTASAFNCSPFGRVQVPCVIHSRKSALRVDRRAGNKQTQSGRPRRLLFALLLLRYPAKFTFHSLFEFPRFAERNQQFTAHIQPAPSMPSSWLPITLDIVFFPCLQEGSDFHYHSSPMLHSVVPYMKNLFSYSDIRQHTVAKQNRILL